MRKLAHVSNQKINTAWKDLRRPQSQGKRGMRCRQKMSAKH